MRRKCLICGEALEVKIKDKIINTKNMYLVHAECPKCKAKVRWTEEHLDGEIKFSEMEF